MESQAKVTPEIREGNAQSPVKSDDAKPPAEGTAPLVKDETNTVEKDDANKKCKKQKCTKEHSKSKQKKSKKEADASDSSSDSDSDDEHESSSSTDSESEESASEAEEAKKKRVPKKRQDSHKSRHKSRSKKHKKLAKAQESSDSESDSGDSIHDSSSSDAEGDKEPSRKELAKQLQQLQQEFSRLQQMPSPGIAYPEYSNPYGAAGDPYDRLLQGLGARPPGLANYPPPTRARRGGYPPGRTNGGPLAARIETDRLYGGGGEKQSPGSNKQLKASKLDYKRVDQVWDNQIHNYKLQDTAVGTTDAQYDEFLFHVRRTFDWEGKYKATVVDIKSKLLRECLQDVMGNIKGVSLVEDTPKLDPNMLFL